MRAYLSVVRPALSGRVGRYAVPVVLAVGWLTVALLHLRMPYPSDQLHYLQVASGFPQPIEGSSLTHQMTRFGLTGPTRLAMVFFGYSQAAYYTVPLLSGLLLLLGTYAIGALLFSRVVGAASAIALMTYTPVFFEATELMPDLFATALFTVAVAVAIAVRRGSSAARPWALSLIGFLLGWSYLVREFMVFLWPLVIIVLWPRRAGGGPRRPALAWLVWLVAPIAVLWAAETLLCWSVYDDPLARLRSITGHGEGPTPPAIAETFQNMPRRVYLARLWAVLDGDRYGYYPEHWVIRPLLVGAVAGGLLRPRRLGIFLLWMLLMWVPLTLLGGLLDPSTPKLRLQLIRYWFPVFPALVLGGTAALWLALRHARDRLEGRLEGRRPRVGERRSPAAVTAVITRLVAMAPALAVLFTAGAGALIAADHWARDQAVTRGTRDMAAFRSWMDRHGGGVRTVWTDGRTGHVLKVFRQGPFGGQVWTAQIRRLEPDASVSASASAAVHVSAPVSASAPAPGDLIVLFDTETGAVCGLCRKYARDALGEPVIPAAGWRQVYATRDGILRVYQMV